jgi:septum formation protein
MNWDFLGRESVILASSSPRRRELLSETGMKFSIKMVAVEETVPSDTTVERTAMELARRKALTAAEGEVQGWILAADTIVVIDQGTLGKPVDMEDARRMLKLLSGKTHRVITGFAILHLPSRKMIFDYNTTEVTFYTLSDQEIEQYLATGEAMDKAGAYGAQGAGRFLIEKIDGCFFNVVGLPLAQLWRSWKKFQMEINYV